MEQMGLDYRGQQKFEFEPLPDEMIDQNTNPAHITQSRLTHDELMAAMPQLTEGQRQVILLKFIEGFDNAEIASLMDKSEGAIRILQHRALLALRQLLVEEVPDVTYRMEFPLFHPQAFSLQFYYSHLG